MINAIPLTDFAGIEPRTVSCVVPTLYIIRGVPGAGKSTLAKQMLKNPKFSVKLHFEADMYFIKNETYCWNRDELKAAHEWCFNKVKDALADDRNCIVSNTFVTKWSIEKYVSLCDELNCRYVVLRVDGKYNNVHGVPPEVVNNMRKKFEDYPGEIFVK